MASGAALPPLLMESRFRRMAGRCGSISVQSRAKEIMKFTVICLAVFWAGPSLLGFAQNPDALGFSDVYEAGSLGEANATGIGDGIRVYESDPDGQLNLTGEVRSDGRAFQRDERGRMRKTGEIGGDGSVYERDETGRLRKTREIGEDGSVYEKDEHGQMRKVGRVK